MIDLSWAAGLLPLAAVGFGVGLLVGLTGVGGGALMTPPATVAPSMALTSTKLPVAGRSRKRSSAVERPSRMRQSAMSLTAQA